MGDWFVVGMVLAGHHPVDLVGRQPHLGAEAPQGAQASSANAADDNVVDAEVKEVKKG